MSNSNLDSMLATDSDTGATLSGFSSSQSAAEPEQTAGALLRLAREAAGMHIAALAVSLKVPVRKLEALEQDRLDLLPDLVFVRALASSVCRTLKLDAAPVLERLPQTSAPKLSYQGAGINAPFRSPGDGPGPSIWAQVSRPAVLAGLVFLLGALVLILLPAVKQDRAPDKLETEETQVKGEAFKPVSEPAMMAGARLAGDARPVVSLQQGGEPALGAGAAAAEGGWPAEPVTATASLSVPASISAANVAAVPAPASPLASATAALGGAAAPAHPAPQTTPSGIVTFRAKGESWIEVTDAKGTVVLRRTLTTGEVAGASGALPLATVIGRADATQVQVRGQAFDLTTVTRDNVARFEVK